MTTIQKKNITTGSGNSDVLNSGGETKKFFDNARSLYIILLLVSFIVYGNTLNNDYAYDDLSAITKNSIVTKGMSAIPEILSTPYRYGFFKTTNDLYRPLSLVMFAIEYQVFGGGAAAGHFINILVFACCVVLLFSFVDNLFDNKKTGAAFVAAILFAVHPIHTEVVANIKSRDELMCFLFAFLSLRIYAKYYQNGKTMQLALACLVFFLSLLSKETSIAFVAIIPRIFFFYKSGNNSRRIFITLSCLLAAAAFLLIRSSVLATYHANDFTDIKFIDNALVGAPSVASRYATAIFGLGKYLALLFVPYPLICDYSYNNIPFVNFSNVFVLLSLVVYLSLFAIGVYRIIKVPKDPFAFGILFFLITIALFSNIFFLIGAQFAERFVFFASAGFCCLVTFALERWVAKTALVNVASVFLQKRLLYFISAVVLVFAVMTIIRNNDWANSLSIYRAGVKSAPNNARLYFFVGNELLISNAAEERDPTVRNQIADEAIGDLRQALLIYPRYGEAHKVLANGYFIRSQLDSAELHYRKAAELWPEDIEAWNNLDVVYFNAKKYRESIGTCLAVMKIDPQNIEKFNNIGICYMRLMKYDSAVYFLKTGLTRNTSFNPFLENLALAYKLDSKIDSAKKYESMAQQHNPGFHIF